ncbi:hypothetical protein, partial [Salinivibrio costicola]|uniref:hypothetical protein n=1 Tax=Salinivibrio costicola TaxID=51367 RepID=UPI001F2BC4DC
YGEEQPRARLGALALSVLCIPSSVFGILNTERYAYRIRRRVRLGTIRFFRIPYSVFRPLEPRIFLASSL